MRLVQFRALDGSRGVAVVGDDAQGNVVHGISTTFELASRAIAEKLSLEDMTERQGLGESVDIRAALAEGRVLAPLG